jgi:transcriptional regulator with XRE-family HTH domain
MIDPKNKFAEHLATLMEEHDPPLGIKELAEAIGITYEHARRLVRGLSIPSPAILIVLADVFGVDRGVLQGLAKTTKFERQYGRTGDDCEGLEYAQREAACRDSYARQEVSP